METPRLDHIVVAVRNLDSARAQYEALGFTCTPRAQHPWGTANSLVQFAGLNFIELLEIDRPNLIPPHDSSFVPPFFSFGAFNQRYLQDREGMSMLVFEGNDPHGDVARWGASGLDTYAPFDFERIATLPDGQKVRVAFSLAFATSPTMPEVAFFSCQNKYPENFWKAAYQQHENTALEIIDVTMVAAEPADHFAVLAGLTDPKAVAGLGSGLTADCGPHTVTILPPETFIAHFPGARLQSDSPHLASCTILCRDLEAVAAHAAAAAVPVNRADGRVWVSSRAGCGVLLEFVEAE